MAISSFSEAGIPSHPPLIASSRNDQRRLSWVERVIIFQYTVGPFLYFIRATPFEDTLIGAILLRTLEPLIFLITAFSIIRIQHIRIDIPFILLSSLAAYGALSGFLQGNELVDITGGLTRFSLGLLLYLYFRNAQFDERKFSYFIKWLAIFACSSLFICLTTLFLVKHLFDLNVYLGIASQVLIVVFFFGIYKRNVIVPVLALILILASGKRGVLAALLLGIFLHSGFWLIQVRFLQIFKLFVLSALALATIAITAPEAIEPVTSKLFPEERVNINQYSSGRLNEVMSAIDFYSDSADRILLGAGFGFTYTYIQENLQDENVEEYKNVHFSYINPVITFGIGLSFIYFGALSAIVAGAVFPIRRNFDWALQCSCITLLIYWCFVFGLYSESIFWACLGYLNRVRVGPPHG